MQALHYRKLSRNCKEGVTDLSMITVKIVIPFAIIKTTTVHSVLTRRPHILITCY